MPLDEFSVQSIESSRP